MSFCTISNYRFSSSSSSLSSASTTTTPDNETNMGITNTSPPPNVLEEIFQILTPATIMPATSMVDQGVRVGGPALPSLPAIITDYDFSPIFNNHLLMETLLGEILLSETLSTQVMSSTKPPSMETLLTLKTAEILNRFDVKFESIRLCGRVSSVEPVHSSPTPTIFIQARREMTDLRWLTAAWNILFYLHHLEIFMTVEIADPALSDPRQSLNIDHMGNVERSYI